MLKLRPLIRNWTQLISLLLSANLWLHLYNLQQIQRQMNTYLSTKESGYKAVAFCLIGM